jgi:hypothetical protein
MIHFDFERKLLVDLCIASDESHRLDNVAIGEVRSRRGMSRMSRKRTKRAGDICVADGANI